VKRHPALIPLSHDHHHGLSEARRLRRASTADDAARRVAVERFLRFYGDETVGHFSVEEELVFPLLVGCGEPAEQLVVKALLEHQRIRSMAAGLEAAHATGDADPSLMRQLAELLENHIRFEERQLFPVLEQSVSDSTLTRTGSCLRDAVAERDGPR
jgi:hemerythrin-like domain-containing protein